MYHVHITDAGTSPVSAALLLAHLALRGGSLQGRLLVSASSVADGHNGQGGGSSSGAAAAAAAAGAAEGRAEVREMLAAAALLDGKPIVADSDDGQEGEDEDGAAGAVGDAGLSSILPADVAASIRPYPYLHQSFAAAERGLRMAATTPTPSRDAAATAPYFDFVIAADLAAYDAVMDYYSSSRCAALGRHGKTEAGQHVAEEEGELPSHLAVIHVASQDVARAGPLVQRLLATILPAAAAEDGNEQEVERPASGSELMTRLAREAWMDSIDGAVSSFSQLLGVDVLASIL